MRTAEQLRELAGECRRLAAEADERTAANLIMLAEEYEAEAERQGREPPASRPEPVQPQ